MPSHYAQAPTKLIDIQQRAREMTPESLAFYMGLSPQIPPAESTGIDPRRLPFNDISPQLRDQRQRQFQNPQQNTPFSLAGLINQLHAQTNTPR
jgi:hypothetical protein